MPYGYFLINAQQTSGVAFFKYYPPTVESVEKIHTFSVD